MRRRHFLGWALAGAVAAPESAQASRPPDLHEPLAVEQLAVFVGHDLLARGILLGTAAAVEETIVHHDQVHVQLLSNLFTGPLPAPPRSAADADRRLSALNASGRLAGVHTEEDALKLLYDVESLAIGKYYEALHTLPDPGPIRTVAAIMAADAQHASAIGGLLHPGKWDRVVPVGAVEGKR